MKQFIDSAVLVAVITLIQAILLAVWKLVEWRYKRWVVKKEEKSKKKISLEEKMKINLEIHDILYKTGQCLRGDIISLSRLHNGGTFIDGYSMDKFTTTHFIPFDAKLSEHAPSFPQMHKNVLLSLYSKTFHKLLFENKVVIQAGGNNTAEAGFRVFMERVGISTMFLFLVKDIDGKPIAFLSLGYKEKKDDLKIGEENHIWKNHNKILNLLNLKNLTNDEKDDD